jgi:hypothetical protein
MSHRPLPFRSARRATRAPPAVLALVSVLAISGQTGCQIQTVRSDGRSVRGWAPVVVSILPGPAAGAIVPGAAAAAAARIGQGSPSTEQVPDLTGSGAPPPVAGPPPAVAADPGRGSAEAGTRAAAGRAASARARTGAGGAGARSGRAGSAGGKPGLAAAPEGAPASGAGRLQELIARAARAVLGMRPFPYATATQGGRLGCAQVVSTIMKKAGIMDTIELGVLGVLDKLRGGGWRNVRPPPYRDGDVITWATYDRSGDGKVDPDTHVGVVVVQGGSPYIIANSSTNRRPEKHPLSYYRYPVSHVVRMPGA